MPKRSTNPKYTILYRFTAVLLVLHFLVASGIVGLPVLGDHSPKHGVPNSVAESNSPMCRCHLIPGFTGPCCCMTGKMKKSNRLNPNGKMYCATCTTEQPESVVPVLHWHSWLPSGYLSLELPFLTVAPEPCLTHQDALSHTQSPLLPPPRLS